MRLNKFLWISLIIIVLFLSACSGQELSSNNEDINNLENQPTDVSLDKKPKGITENFLNNKDWTVEKVGLNDQSVEKLQLTEKGSLYALSEGKLYEIQDTKNVKSISGHLDLSTFHILENKEDTIIIAGGSNGEIYTYSILNNNWQEPNIDTYQAPISIIASNNAGDIYVGQSSKLGGGLWISQDNGENWTKINDLTVRGIAIHPKQNNIIYIVDKLPYTSTDGGKTFIKINTKANYGVLIHPIHSDAIYHASSVGIDTTDIGGNISSYMKFYLEGSMTKLQLNPLNVNEWLMGFWNYPYAKGGLYYSENHGTIWTQIEGELEDQLVYDISFSHDGSLAYIATKESGIWVINISRLRNN
jgi:hypothetical protein